MSPVSPFKNVSYLIPHGFEIDNSKYAHMEKNCSSLVFDVFYKQVLHTFQQS